MKSSSTLGDRIAGIIAGVILAGGVLLAVGFVAFVVAAIVYSQSLNKACVERGGVPTRDYKCLKPDALMPAAPHVTSKDAG